MTVNVFFFKQKTAYEMRISDWSSDVCSSDLIYPATDMHMGTASHDSYGEGHLLTRTAMDWFQAQYLTGPKDRDDWRPSPLLAQNLKGLPPAYVLVGVHAPLRDAGHAYAMALSHAEVPATGRTAWRGS